MPKTKQNRTTKKQPKRSADAIRADIAIALKAEHAASERHDVSKSVRTLQSFADASERTNMLYRELAAH